MEAVEQQTIASSHAAGATAAPPPIPFDAGRLDALMEEAGIDALIVTSKHNIQYLLGGYRSSSSIISTPSASAAICRSSSM